MDALEEKFSMLPRAGSFYYKNLNQQGMKDARLLTFIHSLCRAPRQLDNAADLALSGGYLRDNFMVVRFKDRDVLYYGTGAAQQKRFGYKSKAGQTANRAERLMAYDGLALTNEKAKMLAENTVTDLVDNREATLKFPYKHMSVWSEETMPLYGLKVDRNVCIETIESKTGVKYYKNKDFFSYYGLVNFIENPHKLFPEGSFMAVSYVRRRRNLLSFTLRLHDVYGPVDRVMHYYRRSQNIKSLSLAAAQAAGLAVVREDCTVVAVYPLHLGYSYMTTSGQYDAPYRHTALHVGAELHDGDVIGAADLYSMYPTGDEDYRDYPGPDTPYPHVSSIKLDALLPVAGLSVSGEPSRRISLWKDVVLVGEDGTEYTRPEGYEPTDREKAGRLFFPDFQGTAKAKKAYWEWCAKSYRIPLVLDDQGRVVLTENESFVFDGEPSFENARLKYTGFADPDLFALEHMYKLVDGVEYILHNRITDARCVLVCTGEAMPSEMRLNLMEFIEREAPTGCIILTSTFKPDGNNANQERD